MNIIIFGPQGSGKGTQAELIARRRNFPYISTGDIFRYHLKNKTELGQQVAEYVNTGQLVPDELTNKIIQDRINQPDCTVGFVLDGYPRNQKQLEFLSQITTVDYAIVIELSDQEAIKRLSGRLASKCGLSYHLEFNPSQQAGICDKCGDQLFRRDDDQPQAIAQRLAIYHQETEPLFAVYENKGILHRVNGAKTIDEVYQQIEGVISQAAG
ncbi:MAG: adenylate kinase [Candidatus Buchananbacteria bacterium RIFCSPLOWO2_01_FULL_46_12]|uniref:Adenylate kinase n=2 Tax=Candidatus Buchananiibacteriota TaxID=1817903 RepID=A0A1G1YR55_9BACT|nr:MAG: adenylate kinase [Candidatus Buchananbacteria bacterium RIFCSPHIGHO2_01_FULL_44_11]OGY54833.1 MAG: adenylate kinase [Candidatus Buchananbacteria bacterium RIFCSPLOWO2_01_FULL_46_12]